MPGSIVQIVGPGGASSAATSIVSSSITCTAGNQLWVIAISDDATISSITDSWSSGANTYTERGSVIEAAILRRLHHATCQIATGGTGTVTVNLGASVSNRQVWLVEVTGVGAYDAQGTATDTGNNPTDSASATNSAQPAFCVAAIVDYQGGTPTVGQISGSAATNGGSLAAGGQLGGLVEYRSVSTVTAQTANFGNAGFDRTCTVFAVFLEDSAPTISVHPADQTVNDGATATFSVTATGGATPYTYQWQDNSSGSFANVSGATSSSYGPTASYAAQGRQYRCVVTGANSLSVTSNAATLRVAFNTSGTGPRAYPVLGGVSGAGSVESWLQGTATAGGPTTESRTLTSAGIGAASFQSALTNAQAVTSAGVGAFSPSAAAINLRNLASAGVGAANFSSALVYAQPMTSAGVAAATFNAASVLPATASAAGVGAANFTAQSINAQPMASSGAATVSLVSVGINTVTLTSAGAATVTISGTDANGGATIEPRTVTSAGVGSFSAQSAATVVAQLSSAGIGSFVVQAAQIELRTLTSAGAAAASFAGSDANTPTIEARTVTTGGLAAAQFVGINSSPAAERLGGWAKFRRYDRRDDEEDTKTEPANAAPVIVAEAPKPRIRGRIRIADIAARIAEQERDEADALERQAVERARRKRRQQQEEELLLF